MGVVGLTQLARGIEEFHPDVYRCPSDPVPYQVPVYYYNCLVYMNDGRAYSADTGNAPNVRPQRSEHKDGRTLWLYVSYRGSCSLMIDGGGFNTGPAEVRRITEFASPHKVFQMVEGVQATQYGPNPSNQ